MLLRYRPGVSASAAETRLISTVTAKGCPPGSCSVADDQRQADIQGYAGIRDTPLILGAMLVLLGVAALAHVLVTGVRRRRRDLAILKIVGMRKAQLLRVVSWQATALTSAALIVGIPLGIVAGRWSWALFAGSLGVAPARACGLWLWWPRPRWRCCWPCSSPPSRAGLRPGSGPRPACAPNSKCAVATA